MAAMQQMLAAHLGTQTRELQAHQAAELSKAMKALEDRASKQIEGVRREIQKEMRVGHNAHADALSKLQDSHDDLAKRIALLEKRDSSTMCSTDAGDSRRQAIIIGGT